MTDLPAAVTRPLIAMINRRPGERGGGGELDQLATMSRPRFVTFQLVTLSTAFLTCLTVLGLALLKNSELQNKILNYWGNTATCILNNTQNDLGVMIEKNKAESETFDLTSLFQLLLQLGGQCGINETAVG